MLESLIISADFSDPAGPILAGASEQSLLATKLRVGDAASSPLAAVRLLGREYRTAVVIDHAFDNEAGWVSRRRTFQRNSPK